MPSPSPDEPSRTSLSISKRYVTLVVASLSIIVLTCLAFLVPVPYATMRPGPAFDTLGRFEDKPMIEFGDDVKTYPTSGALDFTTVSVSRAETELSLARAISVYFEDNAAVVPKSVLYPDEQSQNDSTAESAAQLSVSKQTSEVAALVAAGFDVTARPAIAGVVEDGPSVGKLEPGDRILAVNGQKSENADIVANMIGMLTPGDTVTLSIERGGEERSARIATTPAEDDAKRARVGVTLGQEFDLPFKIDNNVGSSIGGPSAGTMFALAIYDKLTPGKLTDGMRVAGTGEMTAEGAVGPIGGIRQKMAGAAADRAEVFLVPSDNCREAAAGDDFDMTLVRIETLKGAIDALETLAKDPGAEVPSCS